MLGGFYAAVALGLSIVFGQLDIVNIAHPAFVILGSYVVYMMNDAFGLDPVLAALLFAPVFFVLGVGVYRVYFLGFERTGRESIAGLAFFFGVMFIIEVVIILLYGVDYRLVDAGYIVQTMKIGPIDIAFRMLVPFTVAMAMTGGIALYLSRTFTGRAILAVSQDRLALELMGANPIRIKSLAFGIGLATAAVAGALLIIIGPVDPALGRLYIGRVFAIVILGGMGSIKGTVLAALLIGVLESLVQSNPYISPTWADAVAFSVLLVTLVLRPQGLFGRL
jgi:branched-chain amino acid transport system permease protein